MGLCGGAGVVYSISYLNGGGEMLSGKSPNNNKHILANEQLVDSNEDF